MTTDPCRFVGTYLGLRAIFPRWSAPQFIREDGLPGLERHYARLSADYGYEIQIPETTINILGYQALAEDEFTEAIRIFEINVERYPASANVYDSLAEAQEQGGELAAALANYERAYKRGEEVDDPNTTIFRTNYDRVKEQLAEGE